MRRHHGKCAMTRIEDIFLGIGSFLQADNSPNPYKIPKTIVITQDYQTQIEGGEDGIQIRLSLVDSKFLSQVVNPPIGKFGELTKVAPEQLEEMKIQVRVLALGGNEALHQSSTDWARKIPLILNGPEAYRYFLALGFSVGSPSISRIEYFKDARTQNRRGHILQFPVQTINRLDEAPIETIIDAVLDTEVYNDKHT